MALAGADGYELGYRQIFGGRLELSFAYWLLDLQGELTWVGDEGGTELSGPTRRHGPELSVKWKISDNLWMDGEAYSSRGHFRGTSEAIAGAPRFVFNGGIAFKAPRGLAGNFRLRHLGDHPIVADNSAEADGYTVADLYLSYPVSERLDVVLSIENLFDADVKEAQTYFASRLPLETAPVLDNHFTPGNPFTWRVGFEFRF